jgi:hypothetical protein
VRESGVDCKQKASKGPTHRCAVCESCKVHCSFVPIRPKKAAIVNVGEDSDVVKIAEPVIKVTRKKGPAAATRLKMVSPALALASLTFINSSFSSSPSYLPLSPQLRELMAPLRPFLAPHPSCFLHFPHLLLFRRHHRVLDEQRGVAFLPTLTNVFPRLSGVASCGTCGPCLGTLISLPVAGREQTKTIQFGVLLSS